MWSSGAHLSELVVGTVDVAGIVPDEIGPNLLDHDIVASSGPGIVVENLADTDLEVVGTVVGTVVGIVVGLDSHNSADNRIVRMKLLAADAELHVVVGDAPNFPDRTLHHWLRRMGCTALSCCVLVVEPRLRRAHWVDKLKQSLLNYTKNSVIFFNTGLNISN